MLDLKQIREDPDGVRAALSVRGGSYPIDDLLQADARRRAAQARIDDLRAERKKGDKQIARLQGDDKAKELERLKGLSDEIASLQTEEAAAAEELHRRLLEIPNIPHESVPPGVSDDDNVELYRVLEQPVFDFEPKDHLDVGEALGIIDVERAARTSGSRFAYLKGQGALLWSALSRYVLDVLAREGFTPVVPPVLVRREAMEGTGFLPTDEQQIYKTADDDLYLVGTSEVPLAALHMGEMLDASALPLRYAGISSCFRREAGAHGRDTRGIFRLHQFEKVEMFSFVSPAGSWQEHERLIGIEESILRALELPYRAVDVCAGELGAPAAKKIDLEAWFPGQQRFREVTSCSNTTDYQARRLNCRMRAEDGPRFVHTLNGTAATSSRHLAAIIENHQRADGSVVVPEVLRPYTGFDVIARA
ncbi:MAG TPA: serine--tRNA ligase [Actinomycetota bacterium]|nr:serine--tRNA ligase [Actinomycetota bacterium]